MKRIDQLLDDVAKEHGYKNFKDAKQMQYLPGEFIKASKRLAQLYAIEAVTEYAHCGLGLSDFIEHKLVGNH